MNIPIDPQEIGEERWPREIEPGWHVRLRDGRDVLVGSYVLPTASGILFEGRTVEGDVRHALREYELPGVKRVWTRTPAEQVAYIEAMHRRMIADAGMHAAMLSAAKPAECSRPECVAAHSEVARLLAIVDSLSAHARMRKATAVRA